uniref:Ig-like domain-containing protein n=1 Tax=Lates calcarifer TaxID=8187 RepID=A0A4W6FSI2_LATCA
MTGILNLACLWTLFITQTGFVRSDIQFLERHEGESVVLPCVVEQTNPSPFGVHLKRSWLQTGKVLYVHTGDEPSMFNNGDKDRISVSGDPGSYSLNATISQLRVSDTDRYHCEFYVNRVSAEDEQIRGKTEFFLLVTADGQCGCSSYSTLLYALSSAVAILLLLILIGFVVMYKGKARRRVESHPQVPIYEEMAGVQPLGRKLGPRHREEMETSEYTNCIVKKSCPENHYESPSGALYPST